MRVIEKIRIENFKSIRRQELALGRLNIFIGGNGSGKSNLIQVFRFLREISQGNLAQYSLERGADNLLYFGRKKSSFVKFHLQFAEADRSNGYEIELRPTDEGSLMVSQESVSFHDRTEYPNPLIQTIGRASKEAVLKTIDKGVPVWVRRDLDTYCVYHFHDTSDTAPIKNAQHLEDNLRLRSDASNLAPFLYLLQRKHPDHFRSIEAAIRQVAPFFEQFALQPSRLAPDQIRLEWKEVGSDAYFTGSALSDGTLRFICLAALLLQPALPAVVLLDEPELGLHPAAITLLAGLLSSAATRTQVLVATQSVTLVNQFEPEAVWTVDRENGESVFRRLQAESLDAWLTSCEGCEGYGLGELWEKNVLGARP